MQEITIQLDIAVIGGGIAGLWLLNRLSQQGYHSALFEQDALGCGQTLASQGMIHGGIKYSLGGALNAASEAIADMPRTWSECFAGTGEIDLSLAKRLSDSFYMFSSNSTSSKLSTFLASKLTRGRVNAVPNDALPSLFRTPKSFSGQVYQLQDIVVDVPSLLRTLSEAVKPRLFSNPANETQWQKDGEKLSLLITQANKNYRIEAKQFIFCGGQGNGELLQQLGIERPQMQLRPLQQVMVKHNLPHPFYGHCMGAEKTPRLTISSHPCADGEQVWYLGGSLAEKGADMSPEKLIDHAKSELNDLLPWLDFSTAQWQTLKVNRAEPKQKSLVRPDKAFAQPATSISNVIVGWPTKLALTPNFSAEVLQLIETANIEKTNLGEQKLPNLKHPEIAKQPWEIAFDLESYCSNSNAKGSENA